MLLVRYYYFYLVGTWYMILLLCLPCRPLKRWPDRTHSIHILLLYSLVVVVVVVVVVPAHIWWAGVRGCAEKGWVVFIYIYIYVCIYIYICLCTKSIVRTGYMYVKGGKSGNGHTHTHKHAYIIYRDVMGVRGRTVEV